MSRLKDRGGRRQPLPPATVVLHCDGCQCIIAELSVNILHLAGELSRLRREHAMIAHAWPT